MVGIVIVVIVVVVFASSSVADRSIRINSFSLIDAPEEDRLTPTLAAALIHDEVDNAGDAF